MPDRLSALDVSFLYLERPETAMHVGTVMIFRTGPDGLDIARLQRHVAARIAYVPRYRQRVRTVPGRLAKPVWVDDELFDISYHVRRSALPRPGTDEQLAELVARLQARPLDRGHPLWELIVVEGLAGGRFAAVTKVHQALVDGVRTVDLGQVVLDEDPNGHDSPSDSWRPAPEPSTLELLAGAVADSVRRPGQLLDVARAGANDLRNGAGTATRAATRVVSAVRSVTDPAARSPLKQPVSPHRRFAMVATDLDDYRKVRDHLVTPPRRRGRTAPAAADTEAHPSLPTVNDVMLATLTGALRAWLLTRGEPVPPGATVRTLVPVSVRAAPGEQIGMIDSRVAALLVDLPTGEPSPLVRVHQIAYQTKAHRDAGRAIDAQAIAEITGFAPPTLHSLGARVAAGLTRRQFHLVVTNVPGPQHPLYLDGARMVASYPVMPLSAGQVLAVGVTSYDGAVCWGLNADRDAMADLDVVGQCLRDSLAELVGAVG